MNIKHLVLLIAVVTAPAAFAADATFCRSPVTEMSVSGATRLNDKTIFTCDNGHKGTLKHLMDSIRYKLEKIELSVPEDTSKATTFTLILLSKD